MEREAIRERDKALFRDYMAGDSNAGWQLVQLYEPYIRTQVSKFSRVYRISEHYHDVVGEALVRCFAQLGDFDPARGGFPGYLFYQVRTAVQDFAGSMGYPLTSHAGAVKDYVRMQAVSERRHRDREDTSDAAVAAEIGHSPRRLRSLRWVRPPALSLDLCTADEGEMSADHILAKVLEPVADPEMHVIEKDLRQQLLSVLSVLDARQYHIVTSYFGLGVEQQTLEALGKHYGVSKERIRQLKKRAIELLRARYGLEGPVPKRRYVKKRHASQPKEMA